MVTQILNKQWIAKVTGIYKQAPGDLNDIGGLVSEGLLQQAINVQILTI